MVHTRTVPAWGLKHLPSASYPVAVSLPAIAHRCRLNAIAAGVFSPACDLAADALIQSLGLLAEQVP